MYSITTPNGPVTTLGTYDDQRGFLDAIAYAPASNRFFISDTRLAEIDPTTGNTIRIISDDYYYALTTIPEPSSVSLLFTGLICLSAFGRRLRSSSNRRH